MFQSQKMDESAIAVCANDGVGVVIKRNPFPEKVSPFEHDISKIDDPLLTKVVPSKFKVPTNFMKCDVKSIGNSAGIVVFGTEDERKKVLDVASNGIKQYNQLFLKEVPMADLCEHIGNQLNNVCHTSFQSCGAEVILLSWSFQTGPEVYAIKSNGDRSRYPCCAIGGGKNCMNTKLAQTNFQNLTTNQCMSGALKIMMETDFDFQFQVMRICSETNGVYEMASSELCDEIYQNVCENY